MCWEKVKRNARVHDVVGRRDGPDVLCSCITAEFSDVCADDSI